MSWHSLPLFVRVAGRPVILLGDGEAADAKRRLLERAGAVVVADDPQARLAVVAIDDEAQAASTVAALKARGVLVNAVDRPDLCDFTMPAIVDRAPVLVAIGTGGASAGLAAALRQRLEAILPAGLGLLAEALYRARAALRARHPDAGDRRRALADAMSEGGGLDPFGAQADVAAWLDADAGTRAATPVHIRLASPDPDDLTLRHARALAGADRIFHHADVPPAILDRARADAARIICTVPPVDAGDGRNVFVEMA